MANANIANDNIHRRMARLMVEQENFEVSPDDPRRYVFWKLRNAAWAALESGLCMAAENLEAMRTLRDAKLLPTGGSEP